MFLSLYCIIPFFYLIRYRELHFLTEFRGMHTNLASAFVSHTQTHIHANTQTWIEKVTSNLASHISCQQCEYDCDN